MVEQGDTYLDGPIHSMVEFFKTRTFRKENLLVPRYEKPYHGSMCHSQGTGQAKQKKSKHFNKNKMFIKHEVNVMVQKQVKKALKQKKDEAY